MAQYQALPYVRPARERRLRLGDLYLRSGEMQADAERRSGDIRAQLWGQVGRTVGDTVSQIAQAPQMAREQKAREAEQTQRAKMNEIQIGEAERGINDRENFDLAMGQGSRQKTLAALKDRPELYAKAQGHFEAIDTSFKKLLGDAAAGIADFGYTPEAAMAAMDDLLDNGFDEKKIAPFRAAIQGNPESVKQIVDSLLSQSPDPRHQQMAKPKPLVELNKDTSLYDPNQNKVVASGPVSPAPREPNPTEASLAAAAAAGDVDAGKALELLRKQRPPATPPGRRPMTETSEANLIRQLANQWTSAAKPIKELERQVALMDTGMEAVKRGNLAQGAQTVLVTFQKILDPPSVVRESEYMRSAAGQSLLNRVKGAYDKLVSGGAGVTAPELQKFAELAREASAAQRKSANLTGIRSRIALNADRYDIPHELIFEGDAPTPPPSPDDGKPMTVGAFTVRVKPK